MGNDHNEPYLWRERWRCVTTPSWGGATSQCDATASEHSREPNLCVLLLTRAVRKLCDSCSERMGKSRQNGACGPARADARGGSLTGADASLCICTTIIMMVIMRKQHCSATRAHVGGWGDGGALVCAFHCPAASTIVIWLILPVVICLSQRLSHACLSMNDFIL